MNPDIYSPARQWWENLSEDEARNLLSAIYDVQLQIGNIKDQLKKDRKNLSEHQSRLDFLRDVVRRRLGEPKGEDGRD